MEPTSPCCQSPSRQKSMERSMRMRLWRNCFLLLVISPFFPTTQSTVYPTANASTSWTNNLSSLDTVYANNNTTIRPILIRDSSGPAFGCGFFCNGACDAYLFAIFIVDTDIGSSIINSTSGTMILAWSALGVIRQLQVVWSANRNHPVKENATLHFSKNGNLILQDHDGTPVWSTNTEGRSVTRMSLTMMGHLVLLDERDASIWDSFNYPTDTLILGQTLREGQRLTANVSATNWTEGQLYLTVVPGGLAAYADSDPPQIYYRSRDSRSGLQNNSTYVTLSNGSLNIFTSLTEHNQPSFTISLPQASSMQYIRLESDGHLRLYEFGLGSPVDDIFRISDCGSPTVCGEYGFCSSGQCSCPSPIYFRPVEDRQGNLGCSLVTPLSCQSTQNHRLIPQDDVAYFSYQFNDVPIRTDRESCKQACMTNCSCKAAFFKYGLNVSDGSCYLPTKVFSMMNNIQKASGYNSTAYIKVQDPWGVPNTLPPSSGPKDFPRKKIGVGVITGVIISALFAGSLAIGFIIALVRRKKVVIEHDEEDQFEQLAGLPTRFSFEELKVAAENFSHKLGEGGFGSVFKGTLSDGVIIAMKRLDRIGQGKKEFLAEVKTIGNIHHINLVKLIGFCSEKSHRLLVYEYMPNGSLDKWIFGRNQIAALDWQTRLQIITDVAKGLSYLHEECRQRIAHLDIKPQNILLDEGLHAKVSDFGLSKLIDREQSHVLTTIRGTRGYLAPEWLTSKITEKADVFSFGVLVMEIVCGRKNLDPSQPEECIHLVTVLQEKAKEDRLLDIADRSNDMQLHGDEVIEMMRLAMWCLQIDSTRRPKMSTVVKVLEGSQNVETNIEYNFTFLPLQEQENANNLGASAPPSAWLLSGSR